MSMFEWEIFEDIINNRRHLNVENAGPLHAPINKLTVKRDTKLKIIINTEAGINSTSTAKSYPLGTVRTNNDFLSLTDQTTNAKINIKGIHSYHCEKSHSDQLIKETSKAQSIEILFQNKNKGKYLVEWLANMPDGLVWPDQAEKIFKETREITFGDFCKEANFESSNKITTLDSGVHMVVDRFELFLSPAFTKSEEHKKIKPGLFYIKIILQKKSEEKSDVAFLSFWEDF